MNNVIEIIPLVGINWEGKRSIGRLSASKLRGIIYD